MVSIIRFEKYKDAGTGDYTTLECNTSYEVAVALVNILTNRKKGYPREVTQIERDGNDVEITINTMTTTKKVRSINSDPTLE